MSNDRNYSKSNKRKRNKKKRCQKDKKQNSLGSSSSSSDSSDKIDYRRKQRKNKSHRKKYQIKICACLTAKFPTTAHKLNIIKFKLDEDMLQHQIYFPTFVESLEMIFPQYKETCELLLGENIKDFSKIPLEIFCMPILMCIAED